jgi:Cytidylate kinase-like family
MGRPYPESEEAMQKWKWPHQQNPRDLGAMVDAQVRNWVFKQQGQEPRFQEWPSVTIACEFDAQGVALGRGIAERLGFGYCDPQSVNELARQMHARDGAAGEFDGQSRNVLEDLLGAFASQRDAASGGLAEQFRRIVSSIARHGSAVIVAREASCLVEPHRALRVRLVAPMEVRIKEIETRSHVPLAMAKRMIATNDKDRAAFIRRALGHSIADLALYDVVVNTGTYPQERAEAVVLMAYLAKFGEWPVTAHVLRGEGTSAVPGTLPTMGPGPSQAH